MIPTREACPDTMVGVKHRRNTIKAETIKHEFLHVEPQVGKQEAKDFVRFVVEQTGIPKLVTTFGAAVEVLVIGSVKVVDAVFYVLAGV